MSCLNIFCEMHKSTDIKVNYDERTKFFLRNALGIKVSFPPLFSLSSNTEPFCDSSNVMTHMWLGFLVNLNHVKNRAEQIMHKINLKVILICTFVTCRGWDNTGLMLGPQKITFRVWNDMLRCQDAYHVIATMYVQFWFR